VIVATDEAEAVRRTWELGMQIEVPASPLDAVPRLLVGFDDGKSGPVA